MQPRRFFLLGLSVIVAIFAFGLMIRTPAATPMTQDQAAAERCGPGLIYLPELGACTHGPDPAPTGLDENRRVGALGVRAANVRAASLACDGDGQTGPRVQVLYVRGETAPDRYAALLPSIRAWAAEADQIFQDSAAQTGGTRQIRFVHDAGCGPVVDHVPVSANAIGGFGTMAGELRAKGYNRPDRIYLSFVDTTAAGICGIAGIRNDDQASGANRNNVGPSFARVDAGCWGGRVAAHELMHNLGGVQHSAPNTSYGFHCTDENDVMCYSDYPYYPPMRAVCASASFSRLLDCNNDDYFNTAPPAGSYLATHWNPANNQFLISGPNIPIPRAPDSRPPRAKLTGPKTAPAGKRVAIAATATDNVRVASVAFGLCRGPRCTWASAKPLGVDRTRPYRVTWQAPSRGTITLIARVTDTAGNVTIAKKSITVKPAQGNKKKR